MPATSTISPTGNAYIDGVLYGTKWAVTTLTFSFPSSASFYGSGYGSGEPGTNFEALNSLQMDATRAILAEYSAIANLTFQEITETSTQHADIRLAESDKPSTAWAYYPSSIWLSALPCISGSVSPPASGRSSCSRSLWSPNS
jgi:serralysin